VDSTDAGDDPEFVTAVGAEQLTVSTLATRSDQQPETRP
jgi:hypothetical protein